MSPTPKGLRSNGVPITPKTTLEEAQNLAKTAGGVIKDTNDAKKYLVKEGWTVKDESVVMFS